MTVPSLCVGAGGQTQVLMLIQQALPLLSHLWPHDLFRGTALSAIKYLGTLYVPAWCRLPRLRQQSVVSSMRIFFGLVGEERAEKMTSTL